MPIPKKDVIDKWWDDMDYFTKWETIKSLKMYEAIRDKCLEELIGEY